MTLPPMGTSPLKTNKYNRTNAARNGALFTASVLGTSTAISWAKDSVSMSKVVANNGGIKKYALKYAGWLVAFSAVGALVNTVLTAISENIKPNNPPKAN